MACNSAARARTDEKTRAEAAAVLRAIGLTGSDAFRSTMVKIAKEQAPPFEPPVSHEEPIGPMKAARRGGLVTVGAPAMPIASLNAECQAHSPLSPRLQAREIRPPGQAIRRPADGERHHAGE